MSKGLKRGTKVLLEVEFDYDLTYVREIEFIVKQEFSSNELNFVYPSENAIKIDDGNVIALVFDVADTYKLKDGKAMLDTRIHLVGSRYNPQTEIVEFDVDRTLFKEVIE